MSAWKDFVTAALLGTEKSGAPTALPTPLEKLLGTAETLAPEARFLTRAGTLALWRRAGWKPLRHEAATEPAAPRESRPFVHPECAAHLCAMLGGHGFEALPEWLVEVAQRRRVVTPELLPALFDWARRLRYERLPMVLAAGGARARWLSARNPDWNFAAIDADELWETGSRDQRAAVLRRWRKADPGQAREKLEAVWTGEPAEVRVAFIQSLNNELDPGDEPFLERALDDRSKEVRVTAALLLSNLPDSALTARMTARATTLLAFKKGGLLGRASLEVTLPGPPDAEALRDGLEPKPAGAYRALGEKAALLARVLTLVPLEHWTRTFQQKPAALLKALEKCEFASAVACGWALAAFTQHDAAWAQALLDAPDAVQAPAGCLMPGTLPCLLPETARATRLREIVRRHGLSRSESWPEAEALILSFSGHLPVVLAQDILHELRVVASVEFPWHLRSFQAKLAVRIPPKLLRHALDDWPENNPAADFVALLAFRRDALAALAQP